MFLSADSALNWAYTTISRPIVKMSAINYMRQIPTRRATNMLLFGLTLQDQHGQAAQIIAMVEGLDDPAEREYLKARFGRELSKDDLRVVVYRGCAALGFGLDKTEAVYMMTRGYFDGNMSYRSIRRALGCRDQYALMVRRCLYDTLDIIHDRAMADMTEVLERHGLIRTVAAIHR